MDTLNRHQTRTKKKEKAAVLPCSVCLPIKQRKKKKKKGHSDFRSSLLFQVSRVYIKKERKRGKERDRDRQRIKIVDILVLSVESMELGWQLSPFVPIYSWIGGSVPSDIFRERCRRRCVPRDHHLGFPNTLFSSSSFQIRKQKNLLEIRVSNKQR